VNGKGGSKKIQQQLSTENIKENIAGH